MSLKKNYIKEAFGVEDERDIFGFSADARFHPDASIVGGIDRPSPFVRKNNFKKDLYSWPVRPVANTYKFVSLKKKKAFDG